MSKLRGARKASKHRDPRRDPLDPQTILKRLSSGSPIPLEHRYLTLAPVVGFGCCLWCSSLRAHAVTVGTSTRSRICQYAAKQRTRDPTHSPYPYGRILVLVGPRSVQIQSPELSVFLNDDLPASVKELKCVSSQNCARV